MSDSLRDRIAAVLQSADRQLALQDEMPIEVYYASVADAVIAALPQICPKCVCENCWRGL